MKNALIETIHSFITAVIQVFGHILLTCAIIFTQLIISFKKKKRFKHMHISNPPDIHSISSSSFTLPGSLVQWSGQWGQ